MGQGTCSIAGCETRGGRRGWCEKHYQRWYVHGDPEHERPTVYVCTVAGCDRSPRSRVASLCDTHYYRLRRTGRLDLAGRRIANPSYRAAHSRVGKDRGLAATHDCIDCGEQAAHWSFAWRRTDPTTWLWGDMNGTLLAYTGDPVDYDARCHCCARRYDKDFARAGWRHGQKPLSPGENPPIFMGA